MLLGICEMWWRGSLYVNTSILECLLYEDKIANSNTMGLFIAPYHILAMDNLILLTL